MSYIGNEPVISAVRTITEIVATNGQSTFTANGGYTVGFIDVFVNGAQLTASDFTATNGSTVVLNDACVTNDIVRLVAWGTFTVSAINGANITDATVTAAKLTGTLTQNTTGTASGLANTGGWSVTPSGTKLFFNYNGTNVASLDSSGNLITLANITAYGTP